MYTKLGYKSLHTKSFKLHGMITRSVERTDTRIRIFQRKAWIKEAKDIIAQYPEFWAQFYKQNQHVANYLETC